MLGHVGDVAFHAHAFATAHERQSLGTMTLEMDLTLVCLQAWLDYKIRLAVSCYTSSPLTSA